MKLKPKESIAFFKITFCSNAEIVTASDAVTPKADKPEHIYENCCHSAINKGED